MDETWEELLADVNFDKLCPICQAPGLEVRVENEYYEEFGVWVEWEEFTCLICQMTLQGVRKISGLDPEKLKKIKKLAGELEFIFRKQELARLFFGPSERQLRTMNKIVGGYRGMPINSVLEWIVEMVSVVTDSE